MEIKNTITEVKIVLQKFKTNYFKRKLENLKTICWEQLKRNIKKRE